MANHTLGVGVTHYGKISVRQMPKGGYQAKARRRFEEGGKLFAFTAQGPDEKSAVEALKDKLADVTAPIRKPKATLDRDMVPIADIFITDINKIRPDTLVRDAVALWFRSVDRNPKLRPQTRDAYRQVARQSILKMFGDTQIGELEAGVLNEGLQTLGETQPGLARDAQWMLKKIFVRAVLDNAVPVNIALLTEKIEQPEFEEPSILSVDEFQEARQLVTKWRTARAGLGGAQRDRSFVLTDVVEILGGSGLRINEVLGLRHVDVNYDARTVAVSGTLIEMEGIGLQFQPRTKTPTGMRTIKLPGFAMDAIRRQAELNGHPEYIFSTGTGNFVNSHNVGRSWREARRGSDLDWVELKTFRAAVATWIIDEAGIAAASAQLGHAVALPDGSKTTSRHYDGGKKRRQRRTIIDNSAILDALLGPNVATG